MPGDIVSNDNNECGTLWEACSIGQGAFLHEVGHAFGASHTTGIMARGYAQHWPKCFLSKTAYCAHTKVNGITVPPFETENESCWDFSDALSFKVLPHFRLPSDRVLTQEALRAEPSVQIVFEEGAEFLRLLISSPAQIASVKFNGSELPGLAVGEPASKIQFTMDELEAGFDRAQPLTLDVLGMNGKSRVIRNV